MTEQANPETEARLRAIIRRVLNLRQERAGITQDIAGVIKEARFAGFDGTKIGEVCRWLEKCDKHGRDAMLQAEELFELYREVAEGPSAPVAEMFAEARDKALAEMFAGPPQDTKDKALTRRVKAAQNAAAMAQAARIARGD